MSEEMKALRKQLLRDERSGYDLLDAAQLAEMAKMCLDTEYQVKSGRLMDAGALERVMLTILSLREGKA